MHRANTLTPAKARDQGILKPAGSLNFAEKSSLLKELCIQFATWQGQAPLIQQTLFSNIYLHNRANYSDCPVLTAFIDGMLYLVNIFYRKACFTQVLRDEDISFPPTTD